MLGKLIRKVFVKQKLIFLQGFIQALLLTSVFHEGLSFMDVGHKPTCVSTLTLAAMGSRGVVSPPLIFQRSHDFK